ncbi:MAG: mucoidy inhibitor MuiA family protein [Burkholderiales bacterium]|nr:mucoidy inhibitor MuiA family protein [Burkholderiales bacterium]
MKKKLIILAALLPQLALAQNPANSKISNVLVYPGGASVERLARVAAGARELKINCLSARFDVDSLKVQADAGIQVGDVSVQTLDRARAPECANTSLDLRIRELQEQKASISAESEAQDLVIGYLKSFGNEKQTNNTALVTTAEQLRRTGQDALQRRLSAQKRLNELDLQLTPLLAEQRRQFQANPQVRSVQIRLAALSEGEVKLSYRLSQAGWTPVYRAYLDTVKSQVRLERHAQVAQNSGEDWNGINLKLSTSQPDQSSQLYPPSPWTLSIIPPLPKETHRVQPMMMAPPAPVAMAVAAPGDYRGAEMPSFDVSVFQSEYAAEFQVPGKISLNSDGQKTGFVLGSQIIDAQILVRVQPKQEAQAYLLANAARPAGS